MKEQKILYQIKDLDRKIYALLIKNNRHFLPLTPTQIRIIHYIIKHDDREVYQRDIEKDLNLTRATLSGVLKTMEKNNIIKRNININDARSKQIILNDDVKADFIKNKKYLLEIEKKLVKDINKEEIDIFLNVLNKMKENINKEMEEGK